MKTLIFNVITLITLIQVIDSGIKRLRFSHIRDNDLNKFLG